MATTFKLEFSEWPPEANKDLLKFWVLKQQQLESLRIEFLLIKQFKDAAKGQFRKSFYNHVDKSLDFIEQRILKIDCNKNCAFTHLRNNEHSSVHSNIDMGEIDHNKFGNIFNSLLMGEVNFDELALDKLLDNENLIEYYLIVISLIYGSIKEVRDTPLSLLMRLDIVTVKLATAISTLNCITMGNGRYSDKEHSRFESIRKQKRTYENRQLILNAYKQIDITNKNEHRVAKDILGIFDSTRKKPPVIATIKRHLKDEGLPTFDKS